MTKLSGGTKLKKYLKDLEAKIATPATLNVGFLEGATYPDGTPVPLVAASNEFGNGKSPPRPFFRGMIAAHSSEWGPAMAATLKATDYDAVKALGLMGEGIKGQLQQSIIDYVGPPLSPKTVARKGFDKQLIESSHMLNSVDDEVVPE